MQEKPAWRSRLVHPTLLNDAVPVYRVGTVQGRFCGHEAGRRHRLQMGGGEGG